MNEVKESSGPLFRFRVQRQGDYPSAPEALRQFFKEHLEDLLKLVCFTRRGEPVEPDGFLFMCDRYNTKATPTHLFDDISSHLQPEPTRTTKIEAVETGGQEQEEEFYDLDVLRRTEPRIEFIHDALARIDRLVSVELDDNKHIASFRLRQFEQWVTPSEGDPYEVLATLSRICNARCQFCYVHGNPETATIKLSRLTTPASTLEAETRLCFYRRGLRLPHPTYDLEEIIIHPQFFRIARELRRANKDTVISITTNGNLLTDENLNLLKEMEPVEISLSLNAVTPETRKWLMRGQYMVGLRALEKLAARKIRTTVTLVAWPTVSHDEMERVIRYADQFHARVINVIGGGYTRYFPNPPVFSAPEYWKQTFRHLAPLRTELRTPLILQPRLFEEQLFYDTIGESRIIGISPHSPASHADLHIGDVIRTVNDNPVASRPHCISLLALLRETENVPACLMVERNGGIVETELPRRYADENEYLYGKPYNDRFGIHLIASGIKVSSIRQIFRLIHLYQARRVVIVTSLVVRPLLQQMLEKYSFLLGNREVEATLLVPECGFYGGNIMLGDLLVVDDLLPALREHLSTADAPPDLVMIPSASFNYGGWFRDLKGQAFELLRRALPVPIEPIIAENFE